MSANDGWSIVESPFRVEHLKAYEGLFTLGSGYLHVRGSLEEHLRDAPQNVTYTRMPANVTSEKFRETRGKWGTYVPGVFGKHPLLNNEMVNLPWFLRLAPTIDGERLDMELSRIEDYRRELMLDAATLVRTFRWQTRSGRQIRVTFERFISAARPYLCLQRLTLIADQDAELVLRAGIDADVRTNGYDHFASVRLTESPDVGIMCQVKTDAGDDVFISSYLKTDSSWAYEAAARAADMVVERTLPADEAVVFEKRTLVMTSRDSRSAGARSAAMNTRYEELHAEHADVWRRRWASCDVVLEGDPESQRALRASLYHLLRAHVPDDPRVAIDAKGYAGEAYWGRYFWDTEMYLLPFFLYTDPPRARTLVDFRVQSLPGAQANAARYGYTGARYAWESDAGGFECCPNWQYADHEVHVTADVVYGLAHFAAATDRPEYLSRDAAGVVLETARYWLERLDRRAGDEHLSLLGVMGPDEYTPISHNNSYTNRMVSLALQAAARIGPAAGLSPAECECFARAARELPILRRADGLVLQCEGFDQLADPRFEELWRDRSRSFASQVSQERLYRSQCLKQADVLMLMALFPGEFTPEEIRRAWDYYLPVTTHDSSLSAGMHQIIATRMGLDEEAWRFWEMGRAIDLDIAAGGAAEGIHIANAGAVWQMAVFGFAGLLTAMQSDVLSLSPRLPARWRRLNFPLVWKGTPVQIDIAPGSVTVHNRGAGPLSVQVGGRLQVIQPAAQERWPI